MMVLCGKRMPSAAAVVAARVRFGWRCESLLQPQAWTPPKLFASCNRALLVLAASNDTTTFPQKSNSVAPLPDSASAVPSPLERLRARQLRDVKKPAQDQSSSHAGRKRPPAGEPAAPPRVESFEELGLSDEVMSAVRELGLSKPTEVQSLGVPAVLAGESVVIASHTGSGKTLAYMLPIVQSLRRDELESGKRARVRRPRCVVLCPTRELAEQVFYVAKSICHHARFRAAMIGGGTKMKFQEDALNSAVDMIVGTPGRLLMHIQEGHMAYGDIKYVALDEADTMFDRGFAPEIRKFLHPLRNRSHQPGDTGFQTVLVTATITKAVQNLLDEEFPGIRHIHTSTLHKKVASARHDFIKLSGTENKLEALQQVLEPSLVKENRIMVFCNTVNSCRAVDHYLNESGFETLNYHGEVPAEQRVVNLGKFKEEMAKASVPALICTDLAARGLDLVVDHVIMFDFPYNSIDYLHRTGRTARMGAKGRVTSLVTKRDQILADQLEKAMSRGESLDAVTNSKPALETRKSTEHLQARRKSFIQKGEKGAARSAKFQPVGRSSFGTNRPGKSSTTFVRRRKGLETKEIFEKPRSRSKLSKRIVSNKRQA